MSKEMGFYLPRNQTFSNHGNIESLAQEVYSTSNLTRFPEIQTIFDDAAEHPNAFLYNTAVSSALRRLMPAEEFMEDPSFEKVKENWEKFQSTFPVFKWIVWDPVTLNVSIFLLSNFRLSAGKFFYDMIHRWLLPGKKVNVSLFFGIDFRIPDFDDRIYTFAEIVVHLNDLNEFDFALRNLPILETEIRLGVSSVYHASKILEIKGLVVEEKTALIQERIASLLHNRPQDFDSDIFSQMQHFLVTGRAEFKAAREVRQMLRLICYFYVMRREVKQRMEMMPERRHLKLKLGLTRLHLPLGTRRVMSIFLAMNFLRENEIFEDRHLVKALQRFIPSIQLVNDSIFIEHRKEEKILAMYLEVNKGDGTDFSAEEIRLLRRELGEDLKKRVQQLTRPVFMPRNEEEVMRNIVTLSQELRYLRDIPQVIISFDEHTDSDVSFTVIMLRILLPHASPLQELFEKAAIEYAFAVDRVKRVGTVWKKYPKEATVFRIRLPANQFVRSDQSLDLFHARQSVLTELQRVVGEVRDYNGGMISKQLEVFEKLQKALGNLAQQQELLLENFFHSILPVEQRSLLNPEHIKILFMMFLELLEKESMRGESNAMHTQAGPKLLYVMLAISDFSLKGRVLRALEPLGISPTRLPYVGVQMADTLYLGFLYFSEDEEERERFIITVQQAIV